MKYLKYSYKKIIAIIIFVSLLLTMISVDAFWIDFYFNHFDELLEIVCFIYLAINIKTKYARQNYLLILIWILMLLIGFLGNLLWRHQNIIAILDDSFFKFSKFIISYLAGYIYCCKNNIGLSFLYKTSNKISILLTVLSLHDLLFTPFFATTDYRFFINSQKLFFIHPTYLTHAAVTLLLISAHECLCKRNKCSIYLIFNSFLIIMATRAKGIGFLAIFWLVYIYFFIFKIKEKLPIFFVGAIIGLCVGLSSIKHYFFSTSTYSPRNIMLRDSIVLMKNRFPIGYGFASFGSPTAAKHYSYMYTLLGYENNYGMSSIDGSFLSDNFWPTILAQFGFFGFLLMCMIIVFYFYKAFKKISYNSRDCFIMLMILIYIIISSIAETSFFNPTSMLLFFYFAFIETSSENKTRRNFYVKR